MLSKIRHFVNFITLKSIYHAILESRLNYSLTVWAQNGKDKVCLKNCILVCKYCNQCFLKNFKNWFNLATASHTNNTRWSNSGFLKTASHKMKVYGRHSININVIYTWDYLQKLHVNMLFYQLTLTKLKSLIKKLYTF